MIVGVDIDGVISMAPLGQNWVPRLLKGFWNRFVDLSAGRFVYLYLRTVNKEVKESLLALRCQGHTIVVISYMFKRHRNIVERWLRKHGIPFDEVALASPGESAIGFKKRAAAEYNCERFFDDEKKIVEKLGEIAHVYLGTGPLLLE